jgi:hypothetical protein
MDHKAVPSLRNLEEHTYYKWYNLFDQSTSNCNMFRQVIQSAINKE